MNIFNNLKQLGNINFVESSASAIGALRANKARTFLTMLGIIIGVFSVVLLISLVRGVQNYITDQFNSIGSNLVFVMPGRAGINKDPATAYTDNKLKQQYATNIMAQDGDVVSYALPIITTGKTISYRNTKYFSSIAGAEPDYEKVFNIAMKSGMFFSQAEETTGKKVVLLGSNVYKKLFGARKAEGEIIKIDTASFEVLGVLESKGQDFDEQIIVPFTTAQDSLDVDNISYIVAKLKNNVDTEQAVKLIETNLLADLKKDDFTVMTQTDLLKSIQDILRILGFGLGSVAAISLIVGGIGIMNIMLVAVTERIKEIGLRKAVGATSVEIATQFLFESVYLSLLGGLIGLFLGYMASLAARNFIRTEVPIWAVVLALGFSLIVGVAFGTYPAYKASRKDPIEALRYE